MTELFRLGDLCSTHKSYNPSTSYICKIIEIKDTQGEIHYEYDVTTGQGDRNSKLILKLKVIAISIGDNYLNFDYELNEVEDYEILTIDNMHNISIINIKNNTIRSNRKISNIEKNILFFKKNRNRQDKLEDLIPN